MDTRKGRVNIGGGSTTTNGNVRPNTKRNPGRAQTTNMGAGVPQDDMGAMYQFFINMMQAGAVVGLVGGNQEAPVVNNYAILSRDYARLGGKTFIGTRDAIRGKNWLLQCERIFTDLRLNDEQKRRMTSRQLEGAPLERC